VERAHSAYCEACGKLLGSRPVTPALFVRNDPPEWAPKVWFHTTCWDRQTSRSWYQPLT
jgi:hypothetical protein